MPETVMIKLDTSQVTEKQWHRSRPLMNWMPKIKAPNEWGEEK